MTRVRVLLALVATVAFLSAVSAWAEPKGPPPTNGPGRRAPGGPAGGGGGMGLLQNEQVQKELQLTEEQKQKLQGLGREMRDNRGAMQAKVAEILQPSQVERLKQIRLQVGGPMAVLQPDVAKDIELTDEQRGKIKAIMEQGRAKAFGDLSPEQRREKMQQVRKEHAAKVLEVLTPQQREKLDTLKGPKFDLDMSKVRKPGQGAGRRADGPKPPQ